MNYNDLTKKQIISIHKDSLEYIKDQEKEIERLKEDIKVFKFTIKTQQEQIQELIAREDKAIELIEDDYFEDGSGRNIDKVLEILKGGE